MYSSGSALPIRDFSRMERIQFAQLKTSTFLPAKYPVCTIVDRSTQRHSHIRQDVHRNATVHCVAARLRGRANSTPELKGGERET